MKQNHELLDVIRLVRPLYKALEAAVETGLAETGLTLTQRAVLEEIFRHGPLTVPAIGMALIAPRQFIQTTVNALIQRGLVERRENAAHKRSVLIALT
ncbi:MAG: helix-turn-helix domain-containing protein, partial [Pseudomonadota bacterium]